MNSTAITRLFPPPADSAPWFLCRADLAGGTGTPALPPVQPTAMLCVVLEGRGTVRLAAGRARTVSAGDMVFVPALASPVVTTDSAPWRCLCFHFAGSDTNGSRFGFSENRPIRRCGSAFPAVCAVANRLPNALAQDATHAPFLSAFREIAVLCRLTPLSEIATEAKAIIGANYAAPNFTLEQLCRNLTVDHSQLCNAFQKAYGMSMVRYLVRCRLSFAQQLLATTTMSVHAVAASSGFRDTPHFVRSFKSATGTTPRAYRRAHQPSAPSHG